MGSTPFGRAIIFREVAQLGRALGLGPRGRRFESCLPDHECSSSKKRISLLLCGCSLMVKPQPSKLMSWVRFPSPAPFYFIAL